MLNEATRRGFAIDDLATEPVSAASAAHGIDGEPAMVAVTMHVHGKRPVTDNSALTEIDLVDGRGRGHIDCAADD